MEKLVPKLRFPEFEGNWERKKTIDIAPLQRGFDLPTSDVVEGDYPVVYSNGILRSHNNFKVKAPGVVTGRSGTIGKVTYVEKDYWPHNTSLWVTDFKNNNPKFIFYFYSIFNLDKYNAGSTVPTLNRNDVHNIKKIIPQPEEQQKIASFLTSVDERLTLLAQQKEKLELYKKGVMQQIFPSTNSGQAPKLRFKDENGENYPDWEEKKLGEILDYEQPTKYLVSDTEYDNKYSTPVVTAGKTFILGYTNEKENIFPKENLPVIIFDDFTTASQFVNFPFKAKSSAMKILHAKEGQNIKFIFEVMQNIKFEVGGHGRHWISKFANLYVDLPCLEEQQKIASFLSAIDVQIEGVSKKIEQTKLFKKGLLQQLFV